MNLLHKNYVLLFVGLLGLTASIGCEDRVDLPQTVGEPEYDPAAVLEEMVDMRTHRLPWSDDQSLTITELKTTGREPKGIVLFQHGFAQQVEGYLVSLHHIAAHGWWVIAPQYDASLDAAKSHTQLRDDTLRLLQMMRDSSWPGAGASELPVALAGHSRGGKQSIMAALQDSHVRALALWDPVDSQPPFGDFDPAEYPSIAPERMSDYRTPTLIIGAQLGGEGGVSEQPCAPVEDNWERYAENATSAVWIDTWLVGDGGHADFIDACADDPSVITCTLCSYGAASAATRQASMVLTVAFLDAVVAGDEQARQWLLQTAPQALEGAVRQSGYSRTNPWP